ncbi:MAG: glycerol acyltransferase [Flavobacteriales bacterium]|nr:glycerol acyltransferase [Flavobacteriales bacterium]
MIDVWDFEDICPYRDDQVPEVIDRLIKEPRLYEMMEWVYPSHSKEDIKEMLREVHSVDDFQHTISGPAFKVITQMTTSGLTFTNMDHIDGNTPYLFLSNHRDIILDSALLNVSLMEKGIPTTQIAIGNNLLQNPLIYDLVRINKNFIVNRDVNPREMLLYSQRLSNYIRKTIVDDKTSIWIAHKEGRSKDGDDRTANGLLKMLSMSAEGDTDGLKELNILPTVVSYEFDPCDLFKVNELLALKTTGEYTKQENEDFASMIKGVTGHKGNVNIAVGEPLDKTIDRIGQIDNKNDRIRELARVIDEQMHTLFRLWPSNFIAYDWLHGTKKYKAEYTPIQRVTFRNYIRGRVLKMVVARKKLGHQREGFMKQVRELLLQMYANPVINKEQVGTEETQDS